MAENTAKATIRRFRWLKYFSKLALITGLRERNFKEKYQMILGMNATKIIIKFKIIHPKRKFLIVANKQRAEQRIADQKDGFHLLQKAEKNKKAQD